MRLKGTPVLPRRSVILRSTAPEDTNATEASRLPHGDLGDRRGWGRATAAAARRGAWAAHDDQWLLWAKPG
jgi:hypothetical protein